MNKTDSKIYCIKQSQVCTICSIVSREIKRKEGNSKMFSDQFMRHNVHQKRKFGLKHRFFVLKSNYKGYSVMNSDSTERDRLMKN